MHTGDLRGEDGPFPKEEVQIEKAIRSFIF